MNPKPHLPEPLFWNINNTPKFPDSDNFTSEDASSSRRGLEEVEDLHSIARQLKQLCVEQEALFRVITSTPPLLLSLSNPPESTRGNKNTHSDSTAETTTLEVLRRQNLALQYLIRQQILHPDNFALDLQNITETTAHTLEVERVSLWLRSDQLEDVTESLQVEQNQLDSAQLFTCIHRYERRHSCHSSYLEHNLSGSKVSQNQDSEPNQEAQLKHFGSQIEFNLKSQENEKSLLLSSVEQLHDLSFNCLDVAIGSTQKMRGFIRLEYTDRSRQWKIEEESFLNCLTDLVTQALVRYRSHKIQQKQSQEIQQLQIKLQQKTAKLKQTVKQLQIQQAERKNIQSQLQKARHEAEVGKRAKRAFLSNISHELRTPLHAIIGYSDLLCEEATEEGQINWLSDIQTIRQEGYRLLYRVDSILDLVKIEAGQVRLTLETFDPMSVVRDVVTQLSEAARKNQNQLEVCCYKKLGLMQADFARLQQILYNLVENALKFTQAGTVKLNINRESLPDGDWIYFSIMDTGMGISNQQQEHLFEAFSQIDDSLSRSSSGTGLGLTISRHLCRMMGGDLTVSSQSGRGSTFTVCLKASVSE